MSGLSPPSGGLSLISTWEAVDDDGIVSILYDGVGVVYGCAVCSSGVHFQFLSSGSLTSSINVRLYYYFHTALQAFEIKEDTVLDTTLYITATARWLSQEASK